MMHTNSYHALKYSSFVFTLPVWPAWFIKTTLMRISFPRLTNPITFPSSVILWGTGYFLAHSARSNKIRQPHLLLLGVYQVRNSDYQVIWHKILTYIARYSTSVCGQIPRQINATRQIFNVSFKFNNLPSLHFQPATRGHGMHRSELLKTWKQHMTWLESCLAVEKIGMEKKAKKLQ